MMNKPKRLQKQVVADEDCLGAERICDLERENRFLQKENEELRFKLGNVSSTSSGDAQKLKEDYLQKLILLETQVADLKNKLDLKSQFSIQRPKGDEATKRILYDIQSLKAQKVQLQCKMKLESLQFRSFKASLEKEVLQIKREKRRNQYEMQKLLDSNQIIKMVAQRKTIEAAVANKRLKELIECRKASSKRAGAGNESNQRIQAIESEYKNTEQLHALCSEYERQMDVLVEENANLKDEAEAMRLEGSRFQSQDEEDVALLEKDLDIKDLKEQLGSLSGLLRELRLQRDELDTGNKSQGVSSDLSVSFGSGEQSVEKKETSRSGGSRHSKKGSNAAKNKGGSSNGVCCSCSKKSLCKTTKCKCRHAGGGCGPECGCSATKCTNQTEQVSSNTNTTEAELAEKANKKPLSDVGNLRLRRAA